MSHSTAIFVYRKCKWEIWYDSEDEYTWFAMMIENSVDSTFSTTTAKTHSILNTKMRKITDQIYKKKSVK